MCIPALVSEPDYRKAWSLSAGTFGVRTLGCLVGTAPRCSSSSSTSSLCQVRCWCRSRSTTSHERGAGCTIVIKRSSEHIRTSFANDELLMSGTTTILLDTYLPKHSTTNLPCSTPRLSGCRSTAYAPASLCTHSPTCRRIQIQIRVSVQCLSTPGSSRCSGRARPPCTGSTSGQEGRGREKGGRREKGPREGGEEGNRREAGREGVSRGVRVGRMRFTNQPIR